MSHGGASGPLDRLLGPVSVLILGLLLWALTVGVAPNFDTRLVGIGEQIWPGYAAELRQDPTPPDCDVDALAQRLLACPAADAAPAGAPAGEAAAGDDPFGGADPFAEEGAAAAPAPAAPPPAPAPAENDPFAGADPFAEEGAAAAPAAAPSEDDPFAGADPFAEGGAAAAENCPALRSLHARCVERHATYTATISRVTDGVRTYRSLELAVSGLAGFPYWKHLLSLVLLAGGFATTVRRQHIALREPQSLTEHRVTQALQLVVHLTVAVSALADWRVGQASSAEIEHPGLPLIWVVGFGVLGLVNLLHLARPPAGLDQPTSPARVAMSVPLYVYMGLVSLVWFSGIEGHPSGLAIYFHKFVQHPAIYIGIGLYIWAGMMLAETRLSHRVFGLLTPWRLPPALLAWLVVVLAALPTAYSGASGIFVIAAGGVIFEQLTRAGAGPRMALAATAMSGSLGVVLRPCLVVVLVSILNKQVTTDELFSRGLQVFGLTSVLYLIAMIALNKSGWKIASPAEAVPATFGAARKLLPYVLIGLGVLVFDAVVLDLRVSEHTAALVLPAMLIALVIYDTRFVKPEAGEAPSAGTLPALTRATAESSGHVGGLLTLMAFSVALGGVVERAELMSLVPQELGSPVVAMSILVVAMVLVGMTMDALGAVVLVSVTIAPLAYANDISPVHFWMMVLVAFELGYLTPPVAINHLLARQVVGKPAHVEELPANSFFERHEHTLVPVIVMGVALLIVAYLPLFVG